MFPSINAPRKRGAPLGNANALKFGLYSALSQRPAASLIPRLRDLKHAWRTDHPPAYEMIASARALLKRINSLPEDPSSFASLRLALDTHGLINRAVISTIPSTLLLKAARDPLGLLRSDLAFRAITRDADAFFPSGSPPARIHSRRPRRLSPGDPLGLLPSAELFFEKPKKTTQNSFLTDRQWAVLAPLIPPPGDLDFPSSDPPPLIALNRWHFTQDLPGELSTFEAVSEYHRLMSDIMPPIRSISSSIRPPTPRRGRPTTHPRRLLDGIFWKLSTGCRWSDLPSDFPPARCCQNYYRRLHRSGRLYTLISALYTHLTLDGKWSLYTLVESGRVAADSRGRVLIPNCPQPAWQLRTARLILQLAWNAFRARRRFQKSRIPCLDPSSLNDLSRNAPTQAAIPPSSEGIKSHDFVPPRGNTWRNFTPSPREALREARKPGDRPPRSACTAQHVFRSEAEEGLVDGLPPPSWTQLPLPSIGIAPRMIYNHKDCSTQREGEKPMGVSINLDSVPAYLARPEGPGPWPGILVIHEWWGLADQIRSVADRFAALGYLALAPDLYNGEFAPLGDSDKATVLKQKYGLEASGKLDKAYDYLKSHPDCTGKVGSVGFCYGGRMSLELGLNRPLDAVVTFYGGGMQQLFDRMTAFKAPALLGLFGDQDVSIPAGTIEEFDTLLGRIGVEHEITVYPNSGHAFFRDSDPSVYKPEASRDAWARVTKFFAEKLA